MEAAAAAGIVTPWQPWFNSETPKPQVAGYMVVYDSGMTYATIKGAGAAPANLVRNLQTFVMMR